jgi:hypothetical protein
MEHEGLSTGLRRGGAVRFTARCLALAIGFTALSLTSLPGVVLAADDPGLELEIDLEGFVVRTRDLRSGEAGPVVAIGPGSPRNPTPTGRHRVGWVVLRPSWTPSDEAQVAGAVREPASLESPMGVAKIPFAEQGSIALHGGGDPRVLGRPISAGCVRTRDADLLRVIGWLDLAGALGDPELDADDPAGGEVRRPIRRPTWVVVR